MRGKGTGVQGQTGSTMRVDGEEGHTAGWGSVDADVGGDRGRTGWRRDADKWEGGVVENRTRIASTVDHTGEAWPSPGEGDDRLMRAQAERLADVVEPAALEGGCGAVDAPADQVDA